MCASVGIFQSIIREFYRVRNYGARISIFIKHQFSSLYYYYPTCVRAISPIALSLFDRSKAPGTTIEHMAIANGVDFEVTERTVILADSIKQRFESGSLSEDEVHRLVETTLNAATDYQIGLTVHKPPRQILR